MRVCLIGYYDEGQYGLRCLEATLVEAGHEVDLVVLKGYKNIFVPPTGKEFCLLTDLVRDLNPDLIGITVRSPFVWVAKEVTERLRPIGVPIIWGGFHTTVAPEYSIKRPDMILRGEADRTFPMLADALSDGGNLSEVPGLWWKEGDEIHKNPLGSPIEDLDSLPLPLFRNEHRWFVESDKVFPGEPLLFYEMIFYPMMASRGCPQQCTYCANSALIELFGVRAKRLRLRSPSRIVEEINGFKEVFGEVEHVPFMDEVFGYKPTWVAEFCEVWKKEINLRFNAEIHPSLVSDEQIARLKDAGLFHLNMGVQSGSERVRKEIYHRPVSNEAILEATNILDKHGIGYRVEFITNNPLEEAEDLKETLDLLLSLPRPYVSIFYKLTHFPGTILTKRLLEEGIIDHDQVQGFTEEQTGTWQVEINLEDGHSAQYFFYFFLVFITEFRYYYCETWDTLPRPHFYPPWFIRWLERRSGLHRNPEKMLKLTNGLGKFAHWFYYWTFHFPGRLTQKTKTVFRLIATGDVKGLFSGFQRLGWRIALQLGFTPKPGQTQDIDACADSRQ